MENSSQKKEKLLNVIALVHTLMVRIKYFEAHITMFTCKMIPEIYFSLLVCLLEDKSLTANQWW